LSHSSRNNDCYDIQCLETNDGATCNSGKWCKLSAETNSIQQASEKLFIHSTASQIAEDGGVAAAIQSEETKIQGCGDGQNVLSNSKLAKSM